MSTSLLVTGATGFLGRQVVDGAQERDIRVYAHARNPQPERSRLEWTIGALHQSASWSTRPDVDCIIHAAAVVRHSRDQWDETWSTNVEGTREMVQLASEVGARLIFVSTAGTVACFDNAQACASENEPLKAEETAKWPYYASKVAAEVQARRDAHRLGVDLVIVRPPVMLGPGDVKRRTTTHIQKFMGGRLPFLVDGGMHYVDIRDVVHALLNLVECPEAEPIYHFPGTMCSISEFFEDLAVLVPHRKVPPVVPYGVAHRLASIDHSVARAMGREKGALPDPVLVEMASKYWGLASRHAESIGFHPRPGMQTLADTVTWLRANALS